MAEVRVTPDRSRLFWALLLGGSTLIVVGGFAASQLERSAAIARLADHHRAVTLGKDAEPRPVPVQELRGSKVAQAPSRFSRGAQARRRQVFATADVDQGFTRLSEPELGEWLATFQEPGQTAREYRSQVRAGAGRQRGFSLQPMGALRPSHRQLLPVLRRYIELFFEAEVKLLPVGPFPSGSYVASRQQHDADVIADALAERVPRRSLGVFAILSADLFYTPSLNFVFGIGDADRRVGVQSFHRFGAESQPLLRRALLLVSHELGHMLGLHHCVFYECVMNGVNSLTEADAKPLALCPECLAKLEHAMGFERQRRHEQLAGFYRRHRLRGAAAFAESQVPSD